MADEVKEKLKVKKRSARSKVSMLITGIPAEVHKKVVKHGRRFLAAKGSEGNFSVKEAYLEYLIESTKAFE